MSAEAPSDKRPESSTAPSEGQAPVGNQHAAGGTANNASSPPAVPWWNRTGLIAVVTALVAAVAPATTGIKGFFELRVQQEKNRFDMRDKYLERAIDKKLGLQEKERLFEFLVVVFKEDPLREWAQEQLNDATAELKKQLKTTAEQKKKVEKALELEKAESETLELNVTKLEKERDELQRRLASLQDDVNAAKKFQERPGFEKPTEFGPIAESLAGVFAKSQNAVVRVRTKSGVLSGFFISPEGHVVTAAHGFSDEDFEDIVVTTKDRQSLGGTILVRNDDLDVAVLKVDYAPTVRLELASVQTNVGAEVIAIGFLEGRQLAASGGRVIEVSKSVVRYTRENSMRMPGIAGGPLLDASGLVVGLHHAAWRSRSDDGEWTAEAIQVDRVRELLTLALVK